MLTWQAVFSNFPLLWEAIGAMFILDHCRQTIIDDRTASVPDPYGSQGRRAVGLLQQLQLSHAVGEFRRKAKKFFSCEPFLGTGRPVLARHRILRCGSLNFRVLWWHPKDLMRTPFVLDRFFHCSCKASRESITCAESLESYRARSEQMKTALNKDYILAWCHNSAQLCAAHAPTDFESCWGPVWIGLKKCCCCVAWLLLSKPPKIRCVTSDEKQRFLWDSFVLLCRYATLSSSWRVPEECFRGSKRCSFVCRSWEASISISI